MYQQVAPFQENRESCPGPNPRFDPPRTFQFYELPLPANTADKKVYFCKWCYETYAYDAMPPNVVIPSFKGTTDKFRCDGDNSLFVEPDLLLSIQDVTTNRGLPLNRSRYRTQHTAENQHFIEVQIPSSCQYQVVFRTFGSNSTTTTSTKPAGSFRVKSIMIQGGQQQPTWIVEPTSAAAQTSYQQYLTRCLADGKTSLVHMHPSGLPPKPRASAPNEHDENGGGGGLQQQQQQQHSNDAQRPNEENKQQQQRVDYPEDYLQEPWKLGEFIKINLLRFPSRPPPTGAGLHTTNPTAFPSAPPLYAAPPSPHQPQILSPHNAVASYHDRMIYNGGIAGGLASGQEGVRSTPAPRASSVLTERLQQAEMIREVEIVLQLVKPSNEAESDTLNLNRNYVRSILTERLSLLNPLLAGLRTQEADLLGRAATLREQVKLKEAEHGTIVRTMQALQALH